MPRRTSVDDAPRLVTECGRASSGVSAPDPPICTNAGSLPVKTLAAQIWAFCALKGGGRTAMKSLARC